MTIPLIDRSLGNRLIAFFSILILALACVALLSIHVFVEKRVMVQGATELVAGERIFERILADRTLVLQQAATVLVADYGFREAVASDDRPTLRSALDNHGQRIHADLMMMFDLQGQVVASTMADEPAARFISLATLQGTVRDAGRSSDLVTIGDALYQIVLVAVRAPVTIGWVAVGFRVDDTVARELGELTGLRISFLTQDHRRRWQLAGTSVEDAVRTPTADLQSMLAGAPLRRPPNPRQAGELLTTWSVLSGGASQKSVVVLQRSLAEALYAADRLRWFLVGLTVLGLLTAFLGSIGIARGITTPLRKLGHAAQSITDGDYTRAVEVEAEDEVGALARAFNQMRDAIAARESTIMDLAYRDGLTQLPNRALLNDHLQQAITAARGGGHCVSLLLLDLDGFQLVNSTLGHQHGDQVLQGVAVRLAGALTGRTDMLARLGGDEFAVLLPRADRNDARRTAERLLLTLEEPLTVSGHTVDVSGSIGVVTFPIHGDDVATLMSRVDLSMTVAKRTRAGIAEYATEYDQSPERLSLLSELRQAVEGNQLVLFYQPKVDLRSDHVTQVEALVRWIHPQRGFIPPDEFIPFAEQTGYIRTITEWVIGAACRQLAGWHSAGIGLVVCVNVSARDLLNNDLPAYVAAQLAQLAQHAVAPAKLCLEITESAIMDDPIGAQENLQKLHALGLRLSIDDYGTGYSSLAYLKRLPVHEIKIDKAFVLNMNDDENDAIIVRSTIELGHNMGLKVVAEGVDHAETLTMLKQWRCDTAQGYHISKPLPVATLESWLRERGTGGQGTSVAQLRSTRLAVPEAPRTTGALAGG